MVQNSLPTVVVRSVFSFCRFPTHSSFFFFVLDLLLRTHNKLNFNGLYHIKQFKIAYLFLRFFKYIIPIFVYLIFNWVVAFCSLLLFYLSLFSSVCLFRVILHISKNFHWLSVTHPFTRSAKAPKFYTLKSICIVYLSYLQWDKVRVLILK